MSIKHYNATEDGVEPDWSTFDAIEVGPCAAHADAVDSLDPSEVGGDGKIFWCVYGHCTEGGRVAITDVKTQHQAQRVALSYERKLRAARPELRPCSRCGWLFDEVLLGPTGCPNCHGEGLT